MQQQQMPHPTAAVVRSSNGSIYFDPATGDVLSIEDDADGDLAPITRIATITCAIAQRRPVKPGDEFDILAIGYHLRDGQYEPPAISTYACGHVSVFHGLPYYPHPCAVCTRKQVTARAGH